MAVEVSAPCRTGAPPAAVVPVASDAAWVTPEAGGTGTGSGLLTSRVASNSAAASQARLTLFAGQPSGILAVTQDGPVAAAGCACELRPLCLGSASEGSPTASDKARYVNSPRRTPLMRPIVRTWEEFR